MKKQWFSAVSAALFAADQIMKSYAEQNMDKGEEKSLPGSVRLRRVENRGLPLNFLSGKPQVVKALSLTAATGVTVMHIVSLFKKTGFLIKGGLSLLAAGAWSNTFDRFARGYVVDYIGFACKNEKISRITYNLADFFIGAGTAVLSLAAFFTSRKVNKKEE